MGVALRMALVKSGQNGNPVIHPAPGGATNEMEQMRRLGEAYAAEMATTYARYPVEWRVFTPKPQSEDTSHLSGLYAVCHSVKTYLDARPAGARSIAVHLHSDAPGAGQPARSHVGGRYDTRGYNSRRVLDAIMDALCPVFGTSVQMPLAGGDYIAMETLADTPHVALIVEHGDHTVYVDNCTLQNKPREIARASIGAVLHYYGVAPSAPPAEAYSADSTAPLNSPGGEAVAIGAGFAAWLNAHPGRHPRIITHDGVGDAILYLDGTGWLFWRKAFNRVSAHEV